VKSPRVISQELSEVLRAALAFTSTDPEEIEKLISAAQSHGSAIGLIVGGLLAGPSRPMPAPFYAKYGSELPKPNFRPGNHKIPDAARHLYGALRERTVLLAQAVERGEMLEIMNRTFDCALALGSADPMRLSWMEMLANSAHGAHGGTPPSVWYTKIEEAKTKPTKKDAVEFLKSHGATQSKAYKELEGTQFSVKRTRSRCK
jgi:hypothetical protein